MDKFAQMFLDKAQAVQKVGAFIPGLEISTTGAGAFNFAGMAVVSSNTLTYYMNSLYFS
jgi:hypothetical protein